MERVAEPCAIVIFGGTGDLSHRKLMPALFSLYCRGLLPSGFGIIGLGRTRMSDEDFRTSIRASLEKSGELGPGSCAWEDFADSLKYVSADYGDPESYKAIVEAVEWADRERGAS